MGMGGLIRPLSRLLQVKLEREEFEEELRELRERFVAAREEAEQARSRALDPGELEALRKVGDEGGGVRGAGGRVQRSASLTAAPPSQELRQAREAQRELAAEKQSREERLRQRERELAALKGTMEDEVSSRDGELERCRRDLQQLQEERDEATKVSAGSGGRGLPPPPAIPRDASPSGPPETSRLGGWPSPWHGCLAGKGLPGKRAGGVGAGEEDGGVQPAGAAGAARRPEEEGPRDGDAAEGVRAHGRELGGLPGTAQGESHQTGGTGAAAIPELP